MRSTQLITGALAVVATSSLIGLGSTAQAATDGSTTTREQGTALSCTGTWRGRHVYAEVYENSLHGNHVQVVIDDGELAASRWQDDAMVVGKRVGVQVRLGGSAAVVKGLARPDGTRTPVHEVLEDAGQTIESTGVQRGLETALGLHWRGHRAQLDCSDAFRYRLTVTRTPVE
jgi:hypothetical protein